MSELMTQLSALLNKHSLENGCNTPDWILAEYLLTCLKTFDKAVERRDEWYGIDPYPGWDRHKPPSV